MVLGNYGEIIFEISSDLAFIDANELFGEFAGIKTSVKGRLISEVLNLSKTDPLFLHIQNVLNSYNPIIFDDFSDRWRNWFQYRIHRTPHGVRVCVQDIHLHKQAELKLRAEVDRLTGVLDGSETGIAQIGLDGRWLSVNAKAAQTLEFAVFQDTKFFNNFSTNEEQLSDQHDFANLIQGTRDRFFSERQITRPDGKGLWIRFATSLVRSESGSPRFFVSVIENITDRRDSEESLNFALEASQMGAWDYDANLDETRRSPKFDIIFGYEVGRPNWSYQDFTKHIHPDELEEFQQAFQISLAKGTDFKLETRILWADQSGHWVLLRGRVYLDQKGRAVRMAGLVSDITEAKHANLEIQNAKLAAEDANREKSYFLANMSHEIRTPLGAIIGFTEALKEYPLPRSTHERYLNIINRNANALAKLIDDILDLSKVEAGHLEVEKMKISIFDTVDDVVNLLRIKADAKHIKLKLTTSDNIPRLIGGDEVRLRQILLNIVGNAIKFTDKGAVTLKLFASPEQGKFALQVMDTGPGITTKSAHKLFQPFTQADASTSRKYGGTGLGLALSRRLARAMGGELFLEHSEVGQGSTFTLSLPLVEVTEVQPSPPKSLDIVAPTNSFDGMRVLLAEDSEDNQELIKRLLDKKGVQTELAEDGRQAVTKALEQQFDLILMDMQMPELDGYQATRELRQAGFCAPIVALTANAMRHDREKCIEAGCSEYLAKPIDANKLYHLMGNIVERPGSRSLAT